MSKKWKGYYDSSRKFRKEWEIEFPFITRCPAGNPEYAFCKVCKKIILPRKSNIKNHAKGTRHIFLMKAIDSTQPLEECILLEDRQKNKYCIACSEVDADTKKDNPAVSEHAARRTVEESQHRLTRVEDEDDADITSPRVPTSLHPSQPSDAISTAPGLSCPHKYERHQVSDNLFSATSALSTPRKESQSNPPEVAQALCALRQKLGWATRQLQSATDVQECHHLVKLISEIMAAMSSIRQFKSKDSY